MAKLCSAIIRNSKFCKNFTSTDTMYCHIHNKYDNLQKEYRYEPKKIKEKSNNNILILSLFIFFTTSLTILTNKPYLVEKMAIGVYNNYNILIHLVKTNDVYEKINNYVMGMYSRTKTFFEQ